MIDLDEAERIWRAAGDDLWTAGLAAEETTVCLIGSHGLFFGRMVGRTEQEAADLGRFVMYARNNWQAMIDRTRELESQRVQLMSISWAVEEWMGGRISEQDLKDTATQVLDEWAEVKP